MPRESPDTSEPSDEQIAERMDKALRRMMETPPKRQRDKLQKTRAKPKKAATGKASRRRS